MEVAVFGAGYVGLVQGAILAEVGHNVICVDVSEERVENLKKGIIPIYEPGLTPIIKACQEDGTLQFTTNAQKAVEQADIIFIAVGTPPDEDGSADLQYVLAVATTVAKHANNNKIVVTKSTVPVGTSDKVTKKIQDTLELLNKTHLTFDVVSNPEFLKEGSAVSDCKKPDRIIIGTHSLKAADKMRELYADFNRNHDRVIVMDPRSSELTKYAANCMLATKISFMNEMANIAESVGADIENVRKGIGSDPRIGYQFIYPGCGYGGSCFPKDVKALIQSSKDVGVEPSILDAVEKVNAKQKQKLPQYIHRHFKGNIQGKVVALWGLSFKPNTDDMREASSVELIRYLIEQGASVQAFDPEAMDEARRIFPCTPELTFMETKNDCLIGANFLTVVTEWKHFLNPDPKMLIDTLSDKVVFDGRNIYDPVTMNNAGLSYYGIGRGMSVKSAF